MRVFRVAYDGERYRGFQRQPHGDTIEDAILDACRALEVTDDVPNGYAAASRTDAGVSAVAQTVAFEAPEWCSPSALNGQLPEDIHAYAHTDASHDFHATRDATGRTYEYHLHAPEADDTRVADAVDRLSGEQDFHNLTPDGTGTKRDLTASAERDGAFLVCQFSAPGFPRAFVRRAVSLIAAVATNKQDLAFVDRVLSDETLSGADGIAPAAPEPLVLADVMYPNLAFEVDDSAAASAWTVFEQRRVRRETGARVAAQLRTGASRD